MMLKSYKYNYPIYRKGHATTFVERVFNVILLIPDNETVSPQDAFISSNTDVTYSNAMFDISAHDLIVTIMLTEVALEITLI
jgi:protein associated with RNAse G/E